MVTHKITCQSSSGRFDILFCPPAASCTRTNLQGHAHKHRITNALIFLNIYFFIISVYVGCVESALSFYTLGRELSSSGLTASASPSEPSHWLLTILHLGFWCSLYYWGLSEPRFCNVVNNHPTTDLHGQPSFLSLRQGLAKAVLELTL